MNVETNGKVPRLRPLKLMAVLAHPDDESMGMGATLAKYAAEGVSTHLVTATRGEKGWAGIPESDPGPYGLGAIRQAELLNAAHMLKLQSVDFLNYTDGELSKANPVEAIGRLVRLVRSIRPQVVVTFGPEGDYGHPDHIAIGRFTSAALVCAADPMYPGETHPAHRVDKLYFIANDPRLGALLAEQFGDGIGINVDGVRRGLVTWPDWAISARLDVNQHWKTARRAILCHRSQLPTLGDVSAWADDFWCTLLTHMNTYICAYSLVHTGPGVETDFFVGIR